MSQIRVVALGVAEGMMQIAYGTSELADGAFSKVQWHLLVFIKHICNATTSELISLSTLPCETVTTTCFYPSCFVIMEINAQIT